MEVSISMIILTVFFVCVFMDDDSYENWWKNWKGAWAKYRAERAEAKRARLEDK